MNHQDHSPQKDISLPLPARGTLLIIDRDATIISSRKMAYSCYREAFDRVIRKSDPSAGLLDEKLFSQAYHPFTRTGIYETYYPGLKEPELKKIGEVSWKFYLDNYSQPEFNQLIPAMDECLRAIKAAGALIVILTVSEAGGEWLQRYRISFDGYFSLSRMRREGVISGGKPEAIQHILALHGKSPREAVTIGDNPKDHVEEIVSIGTAFGLHCPEARRDLKAAVDIYVRRVEQLSDVFQARPDPGSRADGTSGPA